LESFSLGSITFLKSPERPLPDEIAFTFRKKINNITGNAPAELIRIVPTPIESEWYMMEIVPTVTAVENASTSVAPINDFLRVDLGKT
jgi:hypothetical protein